MGNLLWHGTDATFLAVGFHAVSRKFLYLTWRRSRSGYARKPSSGDNPFLLAFRPHVGSRLQPTNPCHLLPGSLQAASIVFDFTDQVGFGLLGARIFPLLGGRAHGNAVACSLSAGEVGATGGNPSGVLVIFSSTPYSTLTTSALRGFVRFSLFPGFSHTLTTTVRFPGNEPTKSGFAPRSSSQSRNISDSGPFISAPLPRTFLRAS